MAIPTVITDLSQTASSNYPQGTDSPSTLDDVQRAHGSFVAMLRDGKGLTNPVVLASGATTDIGGQNSQFVEISGTTTITSFGTTYNGPRYLRFQGALTLTHNATTLNLPNAANIVTVAGDAFVAIPNQALNGWNVAQLSNTVTQEIHAATGKTTPVNSDELPLSDSAATFGLKKLTWANVKATLLTWLQSTVFPAPGAIGATTPAAGSFTTLASSGNTTLGDASTDTVTVNGTMGVGSTAVSDSGITIASSALVGLLQSGILSKPVGNSLATTAIRAIVARADTAAATFTVADVMQFCAFGSVKGAGSTITNQHGVWIGEQNNGTNNYGITSLVSSGTNKWNIYASGTAANYFAGNILAVGTYSNTTASAANTFVDTDGTLKRSTSTAALKKDIEDMDPAIALALVKLFRAVWYRSLCPGDKPEWSWFGAIAEEVALIDPRFVHFGYLDDDYEIVTVDDGDVQEPVIDIVMIDQMVIELRDSVPVQIIKQVATQVPRVTQVKVVGIDGQPVFKADGTALMYPVPVTATVRKSHQVRQLKQGAVLSPIGLQYERFTVPLMLVTQMHEARITALEVA